MMVDGFVSSSGLASNTTTDPKTIADAVQGSVFDAVMTQLPEGASMSSVAMGNQNTTGTISSQSMSQQLTTAESIRTMSSSYNDLDAGGTGLIDVEAMKNMCVRYNISTDIALITNIILQVNDVEGNTGVVRYEVVREMLMAELCPNVRRNQLDSQGPEVRSIPTNAVTGVEDVWGAVVTAQVEAAIQKEEMEKAHERTMKAEERDILLRQMAEAQAKRDAFKVRQAQELEQQQHITQGYEMEDRAKAAQEKERQRAQLNALNTVRNQAAEDNRRAAHEAMLLGKQYLATVQEKAREERVKERKLRLKAKEEYRKTTLENDALLMKKELDKLELKKQDKDLMKEYEEMQKRQDALRAAAEKKRMERVEALDKLRVNMEKHDQEAEMRALAKAEAERLAVEKRQDDDWAAREDKRKKAIDENLRILNQQVAHHKTLKIEEAEEGRRQAKVIHDQLTQAELKEARKAENLRNIRTNYCRDLLQQQKDDIDRKKYQDVMSTYERATNKRHIDRYSNIEMYATPRLVGSPAGGRSGSFGNAAKNILQ